MQRTNYSAPSLDMLINSTASLLNAYQQRRPQSDNQDRIRLIKELEVIHNHIQALRQGIHSHEQYSEETLTKVSLGAWIYALESIEKEYLSRNALPRKSLFVNTGSALCELITNSLAISPANKLDDQTRLICLAELHQFIMLQSPYVQFDYNVGMNDFTLEDHVEKSMSLVLNRIMKSVKKLMDAVPTEKTINDEFAHLYEKYKEKRLIRQSMFAPNVDEDRPFCAQLGQVVATLLQSETTSSDPGQMDRSYKILLGLLIYMMRTIPGERSELYKLCKSMMNGDVDSLSPNVQFDCLVTLETYLKDNSIIQRLTDEGKKQFGKENRLINLDTRLRMVAIKLEQELKKICPDRGNSAVGAKILGTAAALTLYPIGYGAGSVFGAVGAGAESHANVRLKMFVTQWFNKNVHTILGVNNAGFVMTTPVMTAVYQTVAGNLFGAMFALAGGVAMGGVGYLVIDVMLRSLYGYARQNISGNYRDPLYADNFDSDLLKCLEHLPDTVLSGNKKGKIGDVVGHRTKLGLYDNRSGDHGAQQEQSVSPVVIQMP